MKALLLRNPAVYAANAAWKCYRVRRQYRQTLDHYRALPEPVAAPRIPALPSLDRILNIFFVGTDEQQDRSGTLQALAQLGALRWFTRADGSYGQNDPRPEPVRRRANAERLRELVAQAAAESCAPDVLIAQTWATLIDPVVFDDIRRKHGTLVINISMDDRHQYRGQRLGNSWNGSFGLVGHIDLALTSAPECVDWYRKEGCPAMYFPEASDERIFHPMPALPKIHDVSFVGGRYGIREEIVSGLRRAGVRVSAYGSGWEGGRIATEDMPALFAQSKIVLGVGTVGHCGDFYALKMRDFDGPMSGSLYLTHDNPDLAPLFERGREFATYRSMRECVEKVRYYLREDAVREAIAAAGRARAARDHTWLGRFGSLFDRLRPAAAGLSGARVH